MSTGNLQEVLDAARKLPIEQRRLLAEELIKDTSPEAPSIPTLDALDAVERTLGAYAAAVDHRNDRRGAA